MKIIDDKIKFESRYKILAVSKNKRSRGGNKRLLSSFDPHKNIDNIEDRRIHKNERAANFLRKYKGTDVRVTSLSQHVIVHTDDIIHFDIAQAFDLSDETHWLEDESGIRRVSESLLHCNLGWDKEIGIFVYDDEESKRPVKIV